MKLAVSKARRRSQGVYAIAWVLIAGVNVFAQVGAPAGFKPYPVANIAIDDAASRVRSLLAQAGNPSDVLIDRAQNRLLVQGPASTQELAVQILQTIDRPDLSRQPATPDAERVVRGYQVPAGELEEIAKDLRKEFLPIGDVRIATDPRTRQVIVVGHAAIQERAVQLLKRAGKLIAPDNSTKLIAPDNSTQSTRRNSANLTTHPLQHVTWQELENGLQQVSGGRFAVTAESNGALSTFALPTPRGPERILQVDRLQERVVFHGTPAVVQSWKNAVAALDQLSKPNGSAMHVVPIHSADASRVRTAVATLHGEAEPGTAAALASPPNWGGRLVSKIFQEANQPDNAGGQPVGPGPPGDGLGGLIGSVQIEYLEGLDVIIIRGRPADVARVRQIIDDIQKLSIETQPIVEVYHLLHVNGGVLATLVSDLYEEILSVRQGQVSIRALVDPNAILLIGRKESVAVVKDLIMKLDKPAPPASQFKVFRLVHVSALDAETTIRGFFGGGDTDPREGLGIQVQVLADYRSNSLIVQASPRDLAEVKRLIEKIDINKTDNLAEVRVFRLRNALAEDLAEVLQTAISGPTDGQAAAQTQASLPSATLQFIDQEGGEFTSGILSDAQVTADPNINALVVRAPADSMDLFAALVEQLDQLPNAEAMIKVFTIHNGDATSLAGMLQQLFGQQVTIGQGNAQFALGALGGQQQIQAGTAGGETSLVPLRFAVDIRTNSIIASASEADLIVVEALIVRLDEADVETRHLKVVRLKNALAGSVAEAITNFLTSQRQLIQQQLLFNQAISPFEQIEREVIVVPEVISNTLIVSATPRYFDEILQVIHDLDYRPKMVMVQVIIAEIALSDEFEFGIELGLQDSLLFDRGVVVDAVTGAISPNAMSTPGFNFNDILNPLPNVNSIGRNIVAGQGLTNFGVGRGNGGLVLSAGSESINVLIRALQEQGQAQVLARPQIMALNNQPAFVQVGRNIARITGSSITQGIVQNQIEDVQTGLLLSLQPLINDDGVIVMSIAAERSRLGADADGTVVAFDQNGAPIRSPPIDVTTAETVISAKSGQTVVMAGLITSDKSMTLRRVPWLADIPIVGRLFEFEDSVDRRTELMIIMTPHIIESDEDYEWIKAMESERMSWCLADVVNLHGDVGLQGNNSLFCCENLPIIYPHSNPVGFEMAPFPTNELGLPPVDFSESEEPLFDSNPVVPSEWQGPPAPLPTQANSRLPSPAAQGAPVYETRVRYGPAPVGAGIAQLQQIIVEPAEVRRLPETQR
jgi:general secretion pathway protein D